MPEPTESPTAQPADASGHRQSGHRHPDLSTEAARRDFTAVLNDRLPRKRAIAQGLARNASGEILLCELTYKSEWDLPGGVVDPGESPATCVEREIREELGLDVRAGRLLAVDWLPPYRGWDDAVLFLFDLGTVDPATLHPERFLRREIKGTHWVAPSHLTLHLAPYAARLVAVAADTEHTAYLEDGMERGAGS